MLFQKIVINPTSILGIIILMLCKLGAQAEEKGRARHSAKGDSHNGELQGYMFPSMSEHVTKMPHAVVTTTSSAIDNFWHSWICAASYMLSSLYFFGCLEKYCQGKASTDAPRRRKSDPIQNSVIESRSRTLYTNWQYACKDKEQCYELSLSP